jgi:hypothetical protein
MLELELELMLGAHLKAPGNAIVADFNDTLSLILSFGFI